jgi:hypothetical protein
MAGYTATSSSSSFATTITINNPTGDGILLPAGNAYWDIESAATVSAKIGIYLGGALDQATNQVSGYIEGTAIAVDLVGALATLTNYGTLVADVGVSIQNGGTLYNERPGIIDGGSAGTGIVFGQNAYPGNNSSVWNAGTIIGETGISVSTDNKIATTIVNNGLIESTQGRSGLAIQLGNSGLLELQSSSQIVGTATAILGTIALYGLSGTLSTVIGVGSYFTGFDDISIQNSSNWQISGDISGLASGQVISNFGPGDLITVTGVGVVGSEPSYQFGPGGVTIDSTTIDIQSPYLSTSDLIVSGGVDAVTIGATIVTTIITIDVNSLVGIDTTGSRDDTAIINNAINDVPIGDVIDVNFGTGTFAIDGTIMLRSDTNVIGSNSTIVSAASLQISGTQSQFKNQDFTGSGAVVNSNISIRGLTFTYPQPLWDIAIWFQNIDNVEISGNTFLAANNGDVAILNASNVVISGNVADGNINGAYNGWNGLSHVAITNNSDYQSGSGAGSGGYWFNGTADPTIGPIYSGGNFQGNQYNTYVVNNINAGNLPGGTGFGLGSLGYGYTTDNSSNLQGNLLAQNGTPSIFGFLNEGAGAYNTMQGNIVSQYVTGNPEQTSAFAFSQSGPGSLTAMGNAILGNEVLGSTGTNPDFLNIGDASATQNNVVIGAVNPAEYMPTALLNNPGATAPVVTGTGGSIYLGTITNGPISSNLTISGVDNLFVEPAASVGLPELFVSDTNVLGGQSLSINISAFFGTLSVAGQSGRTIALSGDIAMLNAELRGIRYTSNAGGWNDDIHFSVTDVSGASAVWDVAVEVNMSSMFGGQGIGTFSSANSTNYQSTMPLINDPVPPPLGGDTLVVQGSGHTVTMSDLITTVLTGNGSNTIVGGNARGYIQTNTGLTQISLSQGGDVTVSGGVGGVVVNAASGNDLIQSAGGAIVAALGNGANTVLGGIGSTSVTGGSGQALVTTLPQYGGSVSVSLGLGGGIVYALSGTDVIATSAGASDTIYAGQDIVNLSSGGNDAIYGGSGALTVQGGAVASDTIFGGTGSLYIHPGAGSSYVVPGAGVTDILAGSGNLVLANGGNFLLTVDSLAGTNRTIALTSSGTVEINGFNSTPITSQSLASGTLSLGLSDGTQIYMTDPAGKFMTVDLGTLADSGWSIAGIGSAEVVVGTIADTLVVDGPLMTMSGVLPSGNLTVLNVGAGSQVMLDYVTGSAVLDQIAVSGTLVDVHTSLALSEINLAGGLFQIDPATVTASAITGSGEVTIDAQTSLGVSSSVSSKVTVAFNGLDGTLEMGNLANFAGTIEGFSATDIIQFQGVGQLTETFSTNANGAEILSVFQGTSQIGTVGFNNATFTSNSFLLNALGNGIEQIAVACFVSGTPIRTPDGDRLIEDLEIGDNVTTFDGRSVPIKWIARRRIVDAVVRGDFPIIFPADSLCPGLPTSEFAISSDHALLIGGFLVPAGLLCNGKIGPIDPGRILSYYHIETEAHEIILAAGVAVETFIDMHNRAGFDNVDEYIARYGCALTAPVAEFAPRLLAGELASDTIVNVFGSRFFSPKQPQIDCEVRGHLDEVSPTTVKGWATAGTRPAVIEISVNGRIRGYVSASDFRPDLRDAGISDGWAAFSFEFERPLPAHVGHTIAARVVGNSFDLDRSPASLSPTTTTSAVGNQFGLIGAAEAMAETSRVSMVAFRADSRPVALVIDHVEPDPNSDAGSEAILCHTSTLCKIGYRVLFVASRGIASPQAIRSIELTGAQPVLATAGRAIETILDNFPIDLAFIHRPVVAVSYAGLIRARSPKCRIVMSVADLEHLRFGSLFRLTRNQRYGDQQALSRRRLDQAMHLVDQVITHSITEKNWLRSNYPQVRSDVLLWTPSIRHIQTAFNQRTGVGFIGNMTHAPNLDAVWWIDQMIEPALRKTGARFNFSLFGSQFPENIYLLERQGLTCRGEVADLGSIFGELRVTVAPLRSGAGVKGKVLSSLQAGVPCVMSSFAADGLNLPAELMHFVSNSPDGIASAISEIHQERKTFERLSTAGVAWAKDNLAADHIQRQLESVLFGPDRHIALTSAADAISVPSCERKPVNPTKRDRLRKRPVVRGPNQNAEWRQFF